MKPNKGKCCATDSADYDPARRTISVMLSSFRAGCGIAALAIAVLPMFVANSVTLSPFLDRMFNLLTYLFAGGVGAIFAMIRIPNSGS